MKNERIWLSSPTMHEEEMQFVREAFEKNWIAPLGFNVDGFEEEMAVYLGSGYAAALSSGTAALHLALLVSGFQAGDIALCSDLTFAATVNPVSYEKGIQVFIDSERETWNMDPEALEAALKKYGSRVRAVIVVNLYGTPAKMDEICELCKRYGVTLIEDAAESLGATYRGRQTGTFGAYNALSFNGNKIITTSGGGMFLSADKEAVEKVRFLSTQARDPAPYYQHTRIGYNYRMSNVVAGIGRGQLLHLNEHIALKKAIYARYTEGLKGLPVQMNPFLPYTEPNYWLSCITVDSEYFRNHGKTDFISRVMQALQEENIESRRIWKPMHMQPVFSDREFIANGDNVSEDIFARGLCLPSDIKMTQAQQEHVIQVIRECFVE